MLRLMYRLKSRHGAVLFIVIGMMALLIAMASAAYYTARASYNTVASNYNYSQLYISAVSAADMVKDSIMYGANSTGASATINAPAGTEKAKNNGLSYNNFQPIKDKVNALNVGESIVLKSNNITASLSAGMSDQAIKDTVLADLQSVDSIKEGMVDGLVIVIKFEADNTLSGSQYHKHWETVNPEYAEHPEAFTDENKKNLSVDMNAHEYIYSVKTTGFYKNDCVTVQDYIRSLHWIDFSVIDAGGYSYDTITVPVEHTDTEEVTKTETKIITVPNPPPNNFSTFFTSTGQQVGNTENPYGDWNRSVKISTHKISDDAYFDSKRVFFDDGNDNEFQGGITTTGDLYLTKFTCGSKLKDTNEKDNDWVIGGSLVIADNNSNDLNIGGSSLYVKKDLVLNCNAKIQAEDIFVMGDMYIKGQPNIPGNIHVAGNIYFDYEKGGTQVFNFDRTEAGLKKDIQPAGDANCPPTMPNLYLNGSIDYTGSTNATISVKGTNWDKKTAVNYKETFIDKTNDMYDRTDWIDGNAEDHLNDTIASVENTHYGNFTSKPATLNNRLTIDFDALTPITEPDGGGGTKTVGYEGTFTSSNGQEATVRINGSEGKDVQINIPYTENGYALELTNVNKSPGTSSNNAVFQYNIGTGASAMPVVLMPNVHEYDVIDHGSWQEIKDKGTNVLTNEFSWRGDAHANNDGGAKVLLQPQTSGGTDYGNVVFEMANFNAEGQLAAYDRTKKNEFTTTVYNGGRKTFVGTVSQNEAVNGDGHDANLTDTKATGMLQSNSSKPQTQYQDHVMLISNANQSTAVRLNTQNTAFCGYIYAPNGEFAADSGDGGYPVFGGMIVSNYRAGLNKFTYAEPKPSDIDAMVGNLNGSWGSTSGFTTKEVTVTTTEYITTTTTTYEDMEVRSWNSVEDKRVEDSVDRDQRKVDAWTAIGGNYYG